MKVYKDGVEVVSLWQYDKNIALQFGGLDTTLQTQIQFGHGNDKTPAVTPTIATVGSEQMFVATVPNKLLEDGWDLLCYAYQSRGDSGWTETMVKIPVNERMPSREWIPADDPGYIDLQDMRDDIDTLQAEMPLKEDVANKVTNISGNSTDTQYPSAKCVYTNVKSVNDSLTALVESLPENYLSTDPGAVGTVNLADGAVTGAKIETGAVTGGKIASSAVTSQKIAPNAVTGSKIAANSVSESHIVNGAVTASKIAPNSVHESQIAAGAVVEGKIAASAVTSPKIANGAVTSDKLGPAAVNGAKIADDSVYAQHLHSLAVTTAKIADSAVTNAKLAEGAVRGNNIVDDSVYAQHIHTGAVETDKIANLAVTTGKLANGAVNSAILAAGAVDTANIANGAVTAAKLATAVSNVLNGAEQTTNKVTSVSSASTDTQYPSAKCVYDYGQSIQTAIEGDLDTVRAALGYTTP